MPNLHGLRERGGGGGGRGITHITTPTYHQSSNSIAERAVQTIKKGLRKNHVKSEKIRGQIDEYLMSHRTTPHQYGLSPSELFFGRRITVVLDLIKPREKKNPQDSGKVRMLTIDDKVLGKSEHGGRTK